MRVRLLGAGAMVACSVMWVGGSVADGASARIPVLWRSCVHVNTRWPHGIGRVGAHDITKGGTPPVTTFKRSNLLYRRAMSYNRGLDRDHDGIACEKL
jgi:Excalibur calcium-binding domain